MGKSKQYKEPRTNFTVRLFPEEKEELEKKSSACEMRMSEYLRRLVTSGGNVDINKAKDRRDLIEQVARLGKLAAKNLFKKLSENRKSLLVVDWYKDEMPREKVEDAIRTSLDEDLPESYDKESFKSKYLCC